MIFDYRRSNVPLREEFRRSIMEKTILMQFFMLYLFEFSQIPSSFDYNVHIFPVPREYPLAKSYL